MKEIHETILKEKTVLFTSCAFGNVIHRVTKAVLERGAKKIIITDIIENELINAKNKLGNIGNFAEFKQMDATCLKQADESVDLSIMFLLLHELPHPKKLMAISEAGRVLKTGGKFILAEFHRPTLVIMRTLSYFYFKIFEPYGLALWDTHDPVKMIQKTGD